MKIKSVPALFNKSLVIWDGIEVKFDNLGETEVKEEVGNLMLEKYPSLVFGEDYVKETPKTKEQEFTKNYAQQLLLEIESVKEQLKEKNSSLEVAIADKDAWAEKVGEAIKERDEALDELTREKESFATQVKTYELRIALMKTSVNGLKKTCEAAGFPSEAWHALTQPQLVDYILSKS